MTIPTITRQCNTTNCPIPRTLISTPHPTWNFARHSEIRRERLPPLPCHHHTCHCTTPPFQTLNPIPLPPPPTTPPSHHSWLLTGRSKIRHKRLPPPHPCHPQHCYTVPLQLSPSTTTPYTTLYPSTYLPLSLRDRRFLSPCLSWTGGAARLPYTPRIIYCKIVAKKQQISFATSATRQC